MSNELEECLANVCSRCKVDESEQKGEKLEKKTQNA